MDSINNFVIEVDWLHYQSVQCLEKSFNVQKSWKPPGSFCIRFLWKHRRIYYRSTSLFNFLKSKYRLSVLSSNNASATLILFKAKTVQVAKAWATPPNGHSPFEGIFCVQQWMMNNQWWVLSSWFAKIHYGLTASLQSESNLPLS